MMNDLATVAAGAVAGAVVVEMAIDQYSFGRRRCKKMEDNGDERNKYQLKHNQGRKSQLQLY